jgi:hypothetical protein
MTLIMGREASFGCGALPKQLHDGSANALPGAQQCTAYDRRLSTLRRAAGLGCALLAALACGAVCSMLAPSLAVGVGTRADGLPAPAAQQWPASASAPVEHYILETRNPELMQTKRGRPINS